MAAVEGFRDIYQTLLENWGDGNPPPYFFIVHVFIALFGDSALVLRMPSILSIVMSLWLFNRRVRLHVSGWVTVLMVGTVSLIAVFWVIGMDFTMRRLSRT
ncbi:MAG: glycosyltransferase family 39 protein [Opitutales bacterium]|nr:glycosyltransferase family 39 protein [Opitutales bacterium]